jgi:L-ribulose-5-phosphate 3-epimerase
MLLALNAWTLPPDLDPGAQCAAVATAGFGGIELAIAIEGPLRFDTPLAVWKSLRSIAADAGIRATSIASTAFFQSHYADNDAAQRALAIDRTRRMLEAAAAVGAPSIVVIPAVVGRAADARPQVAYADALRRALDALTALRDDAEAHAVTIAIENVWNRFLLSPIEAADFIDRVNSPHVGWCLDTGNILAYGYPEDWIRTLAGRLIHVHVKDYDVSIPGRNGFVPLGDGSADWPAIMAALRAVRYDGPLVYEGPGELADILSRMKRRLGAPA